MRRKSSAAVGRSESPAELIARITAERASPPAADGRHRRPDDDAVVTPDLAPRRSSTRRLAPLAVGAVVMLVATTIATLIRPTEDAALADPDLSSALLRNDDPATVRRLLPPDPTSKPSTPSTTTHTAPTDPEQQSADDPPAVNDAPPVVIQAPKRPPAPPPRAPNPAPPNAGGDGVQAAATRGWTLVGGDEFNGSRSSKWGVYQGRGHDGHGTRTAGAISVENGVLVIRGDRDGNTGGMAWADNQRFGKWEMRARFPRGDAQYHPVLILWPEGRWPDGGEIDFAETTSASPDVSFFLHYSSSNQQKAAKKAIDITQWHNYAVEWVDGRVTGFIDGEKWFESTDRATMPPGKMHATIQLDYFPSGGSPQPSEMQVDHMRIYQ